MGNWISLSKHVKEKYNENGTNQEQEQGDKEETEEKLEKEEKEEEKEEKIEDDEVSKEEVDSEEGKEKEEEDDDEDDENKIPEDPLSTPREQILVKKMKSLSLDPRSPSGIPRTPILVDEEQSNANSNNTSTFETIEENGINGEQEMTAR